jgi:hypothetical protein
MASTDSDNSLPGWERYSAEELEQALAGLDRQQYPDRAPIIQRLLEQRRLQPLKADQIEQPAWSELPDWEHYSLDELQQALEGLDRGRYPDREKIILELIRTRNSAEIGKAGNDRA